MPAEEPTFASFILTFDRPDVLRRTIEVVLQQTRRPDLLLVVDNGANPASERVAAAFGDQLEYVRTGENLGSAGGVAFGIERLHAMGFDWMHSIDDDDPPRTLDTVERLRALIARNDDGRLGAVAAVGAGWNWRTGEYRRLQDAELRGDLEVDVIGGSSQLTVSRAVVDEIGPPERQLFFGFYDPLYCLEIAKAGYRLMVDGDLMHRYRSDAGRLQLQQRRALVPRDDYEAIWRRYYVTRNYVHRMTRTFDRPDLARREAGKAVLRAAFSWARGARYGARYTNLQLRGVVDGYRGRLGRRVLPERKAQFAASAV